MDTSNTSPTEEIIRQNNYQMRFLDKFLLKQNVYEKIMITAITCSILDYKSTYDDDVVNTGASK